MGGFWKSLDWATAKAQLKDLLSPRQIETLGLFVEKDKAQIRVDDRTKQLTAQFKRQPPLNPGPALPRRRGHQGAAAAPAHPRHPPPGHPRLLPGGRSRVPTGSRAVGHFGALGEDTCRLASLRIPLLRSGLAPRGGAAPAASTLQRHPAPARQRAGDGAGAGGPRPVGHPAGGPVRLRHRPRRRQAGPGRLRAAPGLHRGRSGDGGDEPVEGERRDDAAR